MMEMFEEAGETILWFLVGGNMVPPAVCVVRLGKEAGAIQTSDGGHRGQPDGQALLMGLLRYARITPGLGPEWCLY